MRFAWPYRSLLVVIAASLMTLTACNGQTVSVAEAPTAALASPTPSLTATQTPPPTATPLPTDTPFPTPTLPPPPRVVASYPVSNDFAVDPTWPVRIVFDQEMDMASVADALSITPWVEGEMHIASPRVDRQAGRLC